MPKGPQGQKRPADVIGAAIRVARIATGEEEEDSPAEITDAAKSGSKGGKRRAAKLSSARRSEIAKKAAELRWAAQTNGDKD